MLHILESIQTKLHALEAKAKAGVAHTEAECAALLAHVEDAIGYHHAVAVAEFVTGNIQSVELVAAPAPAPAPAAEPSSTAPQA